MGGTTTTWTSPDSSEYTIDYVAIPQSWYEACTLSQVIEDFDTGNTCEDHSPVGIQLEWCQLLRTMSSPSTQTSHSFDRSCITQALQPYLSQGPTLTWDEDVEQHTQKANDHLAFSIGIAHNVLLLAEEALCD